MKKKYEFSRQIIGLGLGLVLIVGAAAAQRRVQRPAEPVKIQRFSISMNGGFGMLEGHRRLMDLKTELQYGFGRSFRLGLGLGYLNEFEGRGDDRGRYDRRSGMGGNQGWNDPGMNRDDVNRDFRVIPVTLNAYYILPVGGKWNLFMSGGGSYNFAQLRGQAEIQHRRSWGGQAGMGVEFRIGAKIQVTAEGGYRFVRFHGFEAPRVNPTILLDGGLDPNAGPWEAWIRRGVNALINGFFAPEPPRRFDINLNGFSCRLGLKFGI